ncbi:vlp protein, gamma subfamily (plasmid) [Borrelia duttonii Ly]|uniref:Variable large protein n=1 Tax=Borrelia duttonii (strain Ly) TaxID=412419 RepID=B5RPG1_BORDL|nr:vlp protein, gamma subfamily [Borrelia duttonii Ly]
MNIEKKGEGKVRVKVVILMVMMMVMMGCNSGGVGGVEEGKNKYLQSLVNVSEEFLNVFTSFGEMVGSVLGLNVESKKSDVGNYFKKVQGTVEGVKTGLNKIVSDMKEEKNPNAAATETAVNKLVTETLDKIIEGAKTASGAIGDANDLIGNVAAGGAGAGAGAKGDNVEKLVEGIKGIVEVVLKGVGKADAGDDKKASDGSSVRGANACDVRKLFGNTGNNNGAIDSAENAKKAGADAAKAVGGVTGADILRAIVTKDGDSVKLATNSATSNTNVNSPKDGTVAGGIALRAMAKGGKFANEKDNANNDVVTAVKGAAVSAVSKALDTLTIAIREAMDFGVLRK